MHSREYHYCRCCFCIIDCNTIKIVCKNSLFPIWLHVSKMQTSSYDDDTTPRCPTPSSLVLIALNSFLCFFSMFSFPWYERSILHYSVFATSSISMFVTGFVGLLLVLGATWNKFLGVLYTVTSGMTMIMHGLLCVVIVLYIPDAPLIQTLVRWSVIMLMGAILLLYSKLEITRQEKEQPLV
jgi:uncharacterized protein YhhL (DUF1145 family)